MTDSEAIPLLTREVFGNVSTLSKLLFYALSFVALAAFMWGVLVRVRRWRLGRPDAARPDWGAGLANLWRYVLLQRRVRGRGRASAAHALLFLGFGLLFLGTVLIGLEHGLAWVLGRGPGDPVFHHGLYYAVYEIVLEAAGLALLAGCGFFAYRRWKRPGEVGHEPRDWLLLGVFAAVGVSGYLLEGLRILREQTPMPWLSFVGAATAEGFAAFGLTSATAPGWHAAIWWLHALLVFALIALFPFSRLLHVIAGTVRLASAPEQLGALAPVAIAEVEATGELGVGRVEQFRRRQLVELDACVSCRRCDLACPAFEAGKPLSPRNVVQDIRTHLDYVVTNAKVAYERPPRRRGGEISPPTRPALAGEVVGAEALWACTTCSACVDVCPLGVSPLGFIMDLRRFLIAENRLRGSPAQALQKTDRVGNPWGLPQRDRLAWAAGLDVPTVEDTPDFDVLYWVGCAAAYDRRLQNVARSVVRLLRAADVRFAVLGEQERCTGEAARRKGDELLFLQLARANLATFERWKVRKGARRIVSHCPHCVNSFRQDYRQLGAELEVVHHTEFLEELVRDGRLRSPASRAARVASSSAPITYHDPCYLARVHGVTQPPRNLINLSVGGASARELPRRGRQTSCCGAGGGRMWFDDHPDLRVGRTRVAEIQATGAQTLAVSCPFCLIMTSDGLAAAGGGVAVRDVAELLADGLIPENQPLKNTEPPHGV